MHRVFVAWDVAEARSFLKLLESNGLRGRIIEDREFPSRGELHDTDGAPEVWIHDAAHLPRALELAADYESRRRPSPDPTDPPDPPDPPAGAG